MKMGIKLILRDKNFIILIQQRKLLSSELFNWWRCKKIWILFVIWGKDNCFSIYLLNDLKIKSRWFDIKSYCKTSSLIIKQYFISKWGKVYFRDVIQIQKEVLVLPWRTNYYVIEWNGEKHLDQIWSYRKE